MGEERSYSRAAGIDLGKRGMSVCIRTSGKGGAVQLEELVYTTMTSQILALRDRLEAAKLPPVLSRGTGFFAACLFNDAFGYCQSGEVADYCRPRGRCQWNRHPRRGGYGQRGSAGGDHWVVLWCRRKNASEDAAPTGSAMVMTFDAATGRLTDWAILKNEVDLSTLGQVGALG